LEGNGPNELQFVSDLHATEEKGTIDVLGYQKIVSYDRAGDPVDETVLSVLPQKMTSLNEKSVFYFSNSVYSSGEVQDYGYKLLIISEEGSIKQEYLPIDRDKSKIRYQPRDNFPVYNGKQLFYTIPEPYIYELTENELLKRYYINFGDAAIPEGYYSEVSRLDNVSLLMDHVFSDGYVSLLHNVIETRNVLYFQFHTSLGERSSIAVYSKESGNSITGKGLVNDIDGGVAPSSFSANHSDEWLIGTVYLMDLPENGDQIQDIAESNLYEILADESDSSENNPILMMCKAH